MNNTFRELFYYIGLIVAVIFVLKKTDSLIGQIPAVKEYRIEQEQKAQYESALREIKYLTSVDGKYVIEPFFSKQGPLLRAYAAMQWPVSGPQIPKEALTQLTLVFASEAACSVALSFYPEKIDGEANHCVQYLYR